ncbi:MAG: FHA domain-containing protein [Anaerolineae bacterium]|nr:FHA domain-containing protein [Anaerolineae bacterium]
MKEQHLTQLEAQLEKLVEGAFAQLFGRHVRAQDIAMQLARAMEDGATTNTAADTRPTAPDQYTIYLNPDVCARLLRHQPNLVHILSEHLVELATSAGYRLNHAPRVSIEPQADFNPSDLRVKTMFSSRQRSATAVMQRVEMKPGTLAPTNPQLVINGTRVIPLERDVINVGRNRDNDVVLDDRSVSRHHLQIRLRFGRYMVFDTQSTGGTLVNDVPVKEHNLRSGDVIRIGGVQMVYLEDNSGYDQETGTTSAVTDVEPPQP